MTDELKPAVRVKPLEWERYGLTGNHIDEFEYLERALHPPFRYFLKRRLKDNIYTVCLNSFTEPAFLSDKKELVVEWAQKHFERRILSAIEPIGVEEAARVLLREFADDTPLTAQTLRIRESMTDVIAKHQRAGTFYYMETVKEMLSAALRALTGKE